MKRALLLALLSVAPLAPAHALRGDAQQPIQIRARSVNANEKTGVAVYSGDVRITQGSLHIQADRVEVTMRENELQKIHAVGRPVRVRSRTDQGQDLHASGLRAEYSAPDRQLDLYGEALLNRDSDTLTGTIVRYNLNSQIFSAQGNEQDQVSAVIHPAAPTP